MRNVNSVLAMRQCDRCGIELLTSVIVIPKGENIVVTQYSKFCKNHGTVTSIKEEMVL